jgi:endonuclease YncB( thermonuclease family)
MATGSWIALTGFAVLTAGGALAQAPASPVIDGDTLRYNGVAVHLWGINAPERGQTCSDGWQAGKMAADYLTSLIHNRSVACDLKQSPSTPGKV